MSRWYAIKLFERDEKVLKELNLPAGILEHIEEQVKACEPEMDDDAESIITNQRYAYIDRLVSACVKRGRTAGSLSLSDKIDHVMTNRVLALPIFATIMFLVYYVSVTTVGTLVTDFTNDTLIAQWIQAPLGSWLTSIGTADWLVGLIVNGIIGGAGAVLGFVPQMLMLFLFLAILEDVGYMARVAFIMDRIFRKFGLSGKSFIPMLISSGCAVPGIMASRTIENEHDRRMTIITASFIPCGAKMPIVALIAGALFHNAGWVAASAYFIGVAAVIVSGIMLRKTKLFAGEPAPFVMELPPYHIPSADNVLRSTWERGWSFIKRAGTVIVVASVFIWFASGYGWSAAQPAAAQTRRGSCANRINRSGRSARWTAWTTACWARSAALSLPSSAPVGFGNWQSTVATVMGLVAKEEVVGVFGVLYGAAGRGSRPSMPEDGRRARRHPFPRRAGVQRGQRRLRRPGGVQLPLVQPAVRALLRRHRRDPARDELGEVDVVRHRLPNAVRVYRSADRIPPRRAVLGRRFHLGHGRRARFCLAASSSN